MGNKGDRDRECGEIGKGGKRGGNVKGRKNGAEREEE